MYQDRRFFTLSADELAREIRDIMKNSRGENELYAPRSTLLFRPIKECYKKIRTKLLKGYVPKVAEKWLYDNFYQIKRNLEKKALCLLPSVDKEPRILRLARCLVFHSADELTKEKILFALKTAEQEVRLSVKELKNFNWALSYALLEGVYVLSKRLLYSYKMESLASIDTVLPNNLKSDIYAYFAYKNPNLTTQISAMFQKEGMDVQGITAGYFTSVIETDKVAENLFYALININELTPLSSLVEVLSATNKLNKCDDYAEMSEETKLYYLTFVEETAKKLKESETAIADKLLEFSVQTKLTVSEIIFHYNRAFGTFVKAKPQETIKKDNYIYREYIYVISIMMVSALISAIFGVYLIGYFAFLMYLPTLFGAEKVALLLVSTIQKRRVIPQMGYQKVPEHGKTMIVVSEFVASKEMLAEALAHAETVAASAVEDNVSVAVLIDFKESETKMSDTDEELLKEIKNYKNKTVNIFVRKKSFINGKFSAKDRKRGAIEALNTMLVSGDKSAFLYIKDAFIPPKFVLLLDHDNTLEPQGVQNMVNIMLHPASEQYELCVPKVRYDLFSMTTPYAFRYADGGGFETYPNYSSIFFDLFGKEIFCGKGLYRVKSYEKVLSGALPSEKLLSHDILEGAILSSMSGGTVYEDAPSTFFQDEKRKARWQKGDVQFLPYVFGRYPHKLSLFYKYLIIKNAIKPLATMLNFALLVLGLFYSNALLLPLAVIYGLQYVTAWLLDVRGLVDGIRPDCFVKNRIKAAWGLIYEALLLPYNAISENIVFFSAVKDIAVGKNLMRWTTFAETKTGNNCLILVPSMLICFAMSVALFFIETYTFLAFSIYFMAILAYYAYLIASGEQTKQKELSQKNADLLRDLAQKTYNYFTRLKGQEGLPADNYQTDPFLGFSDTTSPTNLAYAVLAEISAYNLNIISSDDMSIRLEQLIELIEKLPKWKGNLYNWYSLKGKIKQKFVSSVDSGNLLAGLIVAKEQLKLIGNSNLSQRVEKIIQKTDLNALYDRAKKQFYLGYDQKSDKFVGHYDLLASESRLLSYIFVSKYKEIEHWKSLQREYAPLYGNTLESWSGTMFEYLMPALFISNPKGSLLYETERNCVRYQSKCKVKGLWGRSECGKLEFDAQNKYQYYAYGVRGLSLKGEKDEDVIAPYATVLALCANPIKSINNINRLIKRGLCSDMGFYESAKVGDKISVVYSHMTHHQGMILSSLANALQGNIIQKLFAMDLDIRSAKTILSEKTTKSIVSQKTAIFGSKHQEIFTSYFENDTKIEYYKRPFLSTNGEIALYCDADGNNKFLFEGKEFSSPKSAYDNTFGGFCFAEKNGEFCSPMYSPLYKKGRFESRRLANSAVYSNLTDSTELRIKKCDLFSARVMQFSIEAARNANIIFHFYEPVAMCDENEYFSHSVYQKMLIDTEFLDKSNTLIFTKKSPKNQGELYCAVIAKGMTDISFDTNAASVIGRNNSIQSANFINKTPKTEQIKLGSVLNPCVWLSGKPKYKSGVFEGEFITIWAKDKAKLIKNVAEINLLDNKFWDYCDAVEKVNDSFCNELIDYFCDYMPNNCAFCGLIYDNAVADYQQLTQGKNCVLLKFTDNIDCLIKVADALKTAKHFGKNIMLIVAIEDATFKPKLTDELAKCSFYDYKIVLPSDFRGGMEFLENACQLVLTQDLLLPTKCKKTNYLHKKSLIDRSFDYGYDEIAYAAGSGGFTENGDYMCLKDTGLPYSNVVAAPYGGFVATENGGGFTFFGNSRENKATEFYSEYLPDLPSEYIVYKNKQYYRLNKGGIKGGYTKYGLGNIEYYNDFYGFSSKVEGFLLYEGKIKVTKVSLFDIAGGILTYAFKPALSWKSEREFLAVRASGDTMLISNLKNGRNLYIRAIFEGEGELKFSQDCEVMPYVSVNLKNTDCVYFAMSEEDADVTTLDIETIEKERKKTLAYFESINNVQIKTKNKYLDTLFNRYLLYQTVSSRLNAKAGYYQVGGATGFRDQLQDALALRFSQPEILYNQLCKCAAHQYEEGDVQHWWHEPYFGIRTRVSDDKLFLPYAAGVYVETTLDKQFLHKKIPYLHSQPLKRTERDRVEIPTLTEYSENILSHCYKAIQSSLRCGEHGLCIMGSGDWNDGFDDICKKGYGESVVTTLQLIAAIKKLKNYVGDKQRIALFGIEQSLVSAVNKHAYDKGQYARLFTDKGKREGCVDDELIKLDIVPQALAVLTEAAPVQRGESALRSAARLVDEKDKIIKLLTPSQNMSAYTGYISAYPEGVRENGGQYTHAAIWYIWALIKIGKTDEAYELARYLNPIERYQDRALATKYLGEPFVMSGDIYAGKWGGRMGWSWYTGSSAWMYRLILEGFFGIKKVGAYLDVKPNLPLALNNSIMTYKHGNSTYSIKFVHKGTRRIVFDGIELQGDDKIPLLDNKNLAVLVEY